MRTRIAAAAAALSLVALWGRPGGADSGVLDPFLDVPYVQTPYEVVERMLDLAAVGPEDFVIDLGSGDGRIPIMAAKRHGARGYGIDIDPERVTEGRANAEFAGVADRVAFAVENLFDADLGRATVVTMYLLPQINLDLRPRLLALRPGTRIVSHAFRMGDWKPDGLARVPRYGAEVFLWVVPAPVAGRWEVRLMRPDGEQRFTLALTQSYQEIGGAAWTRAGRPLAVRDARLHGDILSFNLVGGDTLRFTGRVAGGVIEGRAADDGLPQPVPWRAARTPP